MELVRTEKEIDAVMDTVNKNQTQGLSAYSGMSYEDGLQAMYDWLVNKEIESPFED
jgi:hypothetical protein